MSPTLSEWYAVAPMLAIGAGSILALVAGIWPGSRRELPGLVAAAALVVAGAFLLGLWGEDRGAFAATIRTDSYAVAFDAIFLVSAAAGVVLIWNRRAGDLGEFFCLFLASVLGMMLVAGSNNLIILFLGIELLSIPLYILSAIDVGRPGGLEAGLKYLVIGALGTGSLLYGSALLYGVTAATQFPDMAAALDANHDLTGDPLLLVGTALVLVGLGFKASAAPFHLWTPDVYQGAPTAVVTFMSTATKVAAFAGFGRLLVNALEPAQAQWEELVAVVAIASMVIGNVGALTQQSVKRMLGYSGVAHAGYALIAVAAGTEEGQRAVLVYFAAYALMNIAAFTVVWAVERHYDSDRIAAFRGLGATNPLLATVLTLSMLSLAGFPPLVGFVGKLAVFQAGWDAGLGYLVVIGVITTVVSMGYYLRLVAELFFPAAAPVPSGAVAAGAGPTAAARPVALPAGRGVLAIGMLGAVGMLVFGVLPSPIIDAAETAVSALPMP